MAIWVKLKILNVSNARSEINHTQLKYLSNTHIHHMNINKHIPVV